VLGALAVGRVSASHRLHRHSLLVSRLGRRVSIDRVVVGLSGLLGDRREWGVEGGVQGPTCWPANVAMVRFVRAVSSLSLSLSLAARESLRCLLPWAVSRSCEISVWWRLCQQTGWEKRATNVAGARRHRLVRA